MEKGERKLMSDLSIEGPAIAKRQTIFWEFVRVGCRNLPFRNGTFSKVSSENLANLKEFFRNEGVRNEVA